jgi:hypothetical protein
MGGGPGDPPCENRLKFWPKTGNPFSFFALFSVMIRLALSAWNNFRYLEAFMRKLLVCVSHWNPEQIFSIQDTLRDCAHRNISVEEMAFIRKLYRCYKHKLRNFPLKMLETGFMFNGSKINTHFAQSFFLKRMIL